MAEITGIDHIYLSVSSIERAEVFYDSVLLEVLGFRKSRFMLANESHVQYFNRHFGLVLRPAREINAHNSYTPGLHHLCLRVDTIEEVVEIVRQLRTIGIEASEAKNHPEYAPDYWATHFNDPDGIRLEITNYRQERRQRHDNWTSE